MERTTLQSLIKWPLAFSGSLCLHVRVFRMVRMLAASSSMWLMVLNHHKGTSNPPSTEAKPAIPLKERRHFQMVAQIMGLTDSS